MLSMLKPILTSVTEALQLHREWSHAMGQDAAEVETGRPDPSWLFPALAHYALMEYVFGRPSVGAVCLDRMFWACRCSSDDILGIAGVASKGIDLTDILFVHFVIAFSFPMRKGLSARGSWTAM